MYITIFVQGIRLMQLSTSNNITSTPWYQQFYMSLLKHCVGGGGGGVGVGLYVEGFLHYEFGGLTHGGVCFWNCPVFL